MDDERSDTPEPDRHGTMREYRHGCRCDLCRRANREKSSDYRQAHLDQIRERERRYSEAHREERREQWRRWSQAHKAHRAAYDVARRAVLRDQINEHQHEYYRANRERILSTQRRKYRSEGEAQAARLSAHLVEIHGLRCDGSETPAELRAAHRYAHKAKG